MKFTAMQSTELLKPSVPEHEVCAQVYFALQVPGLAYTENKLYFVDAVCLGAGVMWQKYLKNPTRLHVGAGVSVIACSLPGFCPVPEEDQIIARSRETGEAGRVGTLQGRWDVYFDAGLKSEAFRLMCEDRTGPRVVGRVLPHSEALRLTNNPHPYGFI